MIGKIVKGIAGFYYVHVKENGIYECKAKGIFRKDNIKPLVGDDVEIAITDEENKKGNIVDILDRKSSLIRPAVANIDQALLIFAITKPEPNYNLLDRFLIMMQQQGLPCIICFNKIDISDDVDIEKIKSIYENSNCQVVFISATKEHGIDNLLELLKGKTTTVAGPSGVGKSSLINCLQEKEMETGDISEKVERGKHTTRHSELLAIDEDTYIMDTPGFSSLDLFSMEKEDLREFYPEFHEYEDECKFFPCSHMKEPVCGVKNAVDNGKIHKIRYENYCLLYEELKEKEKRKY